MRLRRLVTTVTCLLAGLLLLAIVYCALGPSSHMREVWFIPEWLGVWADRNPTFRNFPVFAALAAMLVFVLSLFPLNHRPTERPSVSSLRSPPSDLRPLSPDACPLTPVPRHLSLSPPKHRSSELPKHFPLSLALFAAVVAGVLGVALEFLQPYFRLRPSDPSVLDISWSVAGAFVGAFTAAFAYELIRLPRAAPIARIS